MQQGLFGEEEISFPHSVLISIVGLSVFFKKPHVWHSSPSAVVVRATYLYEGEC